MLTEGQYGTKTYRVHLNPIWCKLGFRILSQTLKYQFIVKLVPGIRSYSTARAVQKNSELSLMQNQAHVPFDARAQFFSEHGLGEYFVGNSM